MSENLIDLGGYEAPENKEKVYLKPGFHKFTVKEFSYTKEEEGKTPNIIMKLEKEENGNKVEIVENLYLSGKLNAKGIMSSIVRLQELYKGLTGDPKMTIKPTAYSYTKKERNGMEETFTIPNPAEITDYLQKKCAGKTAIFKLGGEISDEGIVYTKLTYSGFLYYTDKNGDLCRYKEEREFTDSEYKYAVQKRKSEGAPTHNAAIADTAILDLL